MERLKTLKLPKHILFLVIALIEGIVYSFLLPYSLIPDEWHHYVFMEEAFGPSGYFEEMETELGESGKHVIISEEDNASEYKAEVKDSTVKFKKKLHISDFRPKIGIVKYLPSGTGFYLGVALGLPMMTCTHMAEIFAAIVFAILGMLTIKIAPVKKDEFMFCLLIPMTLQQCSSVNYDSVLIPLSFLLIAYIMKLYYQDKVGWKDILIFFVLAAIVAIIKLPYILIAGAILIISHDKYDLKIKDFDIAGFVYKFRWLLMVLMAGLVVLAFYVGRNNEFIKIIVSNILEPVVFIKVFARTFLAWFSLSLIGLIGCFGQMDVDVSLFYIILTVAILTYMNTDIRENVKGYLNTGRRIWLLILAGAVIILVYMAMEAWTYKLNFFNPTGDISAYRDYFKNIDIIEGVQGRYYIPVLPLIFLALSGTERTKNKVVYYLVQYGFYAYSFLYVGLLLYKFYWT